MTSVSALSESSDSASALSSVSLPDGLSRSGSLHSARSGSLRLSPSGLRKEHPLLLVNSASLLLSDHSQLTPTELGVRPGYFTKDQILAHELYSHDIDFQRGQKRYLAEREPHLPHENMYADYMLVAADVLPGYTLHAPVAVGMASSLLFFGSDNTTAARVIIKLSPNYVESIHVARFLNEWHVTSGRNPAAYHRLWSNNDLHNDFIGTASINLDDMAQRDLLKVPLTLPMNVPGILYPSRVVNIDHSQDNIRQRRMALVYDDHNYRSVREYYLEKSRYDQGDATSLYSGSIRSANSDGSGMEKTLHDRLLSQSVGSGIFDDAASRQPAKSPQTIISILMDMVYVFNVLATCHEMNVVHNGITSNNILRSAGTTSEENPGDPLVVTGWDFSFSITSEDPTHSFRKNNLAEILDLLPYMAPENLGESIGRVDYRSDYYSMGVVLYELLLNRLPLQSDSPAHLKKVIFTQKPISLKVRGSSWITQDLSDIVMKCLEKDSKNRYHDPYTLISDLQGVINHYKLKLEKSSLEIELTLRDPRAVIVPKEKIGKAPVFRTNMAQWPDTDIRTKIHNCFKAHKKGSQFILVTGGTGMGKSSTIKDIKVSAISKFNFVIHWIYNCSDMRTSKYSLLLYGLHSIVKQILASSQDIISEWRHILVTRIDTDVSILYQSIPDLETLMGSRYGDIVSKKSNNNFGKDSVNAVSQLIDSDGDYGKENTKHSRVNYFDDHSLNIELRCKYIIKKFFSLISVRGLTIILDDIHWCPSEEFIFLQEIISFCLHDSESPNISIIAAYRTSLPACDLDKPQMQLSKLKSLVVSDKLDYHEFHLNPLTLEEFAFFLHHSRYMEFEQLPDTEVQKFYKEGNLLALNFLMRWVRLLSPVRKLQFHDAQHCPLISGLPDLLLELFKLCVSKEGEMLMKYAAIISTNGCFRLSDLLIVTGMTLTEAFETLQVCVEFEAIIPSGIYYKVPFHLMSRDDFPFEISDTTVWDLTTEATYSFNHDQVQIHLLKMMHESGEFAQFHRRCGLRYFKKMYSEANPDMNDYLTMASHFLRACEVAEDDEREIFYDVLIGGGKSALATSNLELALKFFKASSQFIEATDKERKIKNMLTICHINYLLEDYQECISLIQEAETKFKDESSTFLYLKIRCLFQLRKFKLGLRKTLEVLNSLDVEISADPKECGRIIETNFRKIPFSVADIRKMKHLKNATRKKFLLIADLISEAISPTYILGMSQLRLALLTQLVLLMLEYGKCASCAIPLIHLANYFGGRTKHRSILKAYELGDVALFIARDDNTSSTFLMEKINEAYVTYFSAFKHDYNSQASNDALERLFGTGIIEVRDKALSLLVTFSQVYISTSMSGNSSGILDQIAKGGITFETDDETLIYDNIAKLWTGALSFDDYKSYFSYFKSLKRYDLEFIYLAALVNWCYYQGYYNEASDIILQRAHHLLKQLPITPFSINYQFNAAVCLLLNTSETTKDSSLVLATRLSKLFEMFAVDCPSIFGAKSHLLKASIRSKKSGESLLSILDAFEDAIDFAHEENAWLDAANANYLCALWLSRTGQSVKRITRHVREAYSLFSTVKAVTMMETMKREFPSLLDDFNWAGVANIKPRNTFKSYSGVLDKPNIFPPGESETRHSHDHLSELRTETDQKSVKKPQNKISSINSTSPASSEDDFRKAINLCLRIAESSSPESIFTNLLESVLLISGLNYGAVILNNDNEALIQFIATYNNIYKIDNEPINSRSDSVPYGLVLDVLMKGERIGGDTNSETFSKQYGGNFYFTHNSCSSCICIPIKTSTVLGALYLERNDEQGDIFQADTPFDSGKIEFLELLCAHVAVSLSKALVYEELEKAKSAAEDATAEKASFLANMSHEIRTPFNSLFACSLFLLDTELTPLQQEYVETIKNSSLVTLNIIDGILAFSKIEHGSFVLNSAPFSVVETIESAIQIASEQANDNGLELMYFNKCPEIETVVGDATRVRQIIINLIGNAVKFTLEGYVKITIESEKITDERYFFRVIVEDTGIGIPQNLKSKVFGAFSQGDGSSVRVHGGAGLGLAISLKLAHIMDGSISFESKEGEGSTFSFSCPFDAQPYTGKRESFPLRVSLILKEKLTRDSIKEFSEFYGAEVVIKEDLTNIADDPADLVLVGKSILESLPSKDDILKSTNARVALITSFGLVYPEEVLMQMGIDGVVFTPIKREKVKAVLKETVTQNLTSTKKDVAVMASEKPKLLGEIYPLRILLAEDNPINLRVACQHLKKLGYKADHAKDGVEALNRFEERLSKNEKYDLILMDIQMPRKDGIVTMTDLRKMISERNLQEYVPQVVALTANVAGEDRELCLKLGMVDFISKPILPEVLLRVLKKVARHEYDEV